MANLILAHTDAPEERWIASAAWNAYPSPLRHGRPLGSCATGCHRLWWTVEGQDSGAAQAREKQRTVSKEVREVPAR
ncbi:MAG: hypothetical protein WCD11_21085 [Solirubrobacteraceae bacterium]